MLKIKEVREEKNFSQDDIVKATGIPKRSYINYEKNVTDIPFSKLQKIATALNVGIYELIETENEKSISKEPPEEYSNEVSNRELKQDLKTIYEGLITNFETISEGVFEGLKGQQKILNFINELDPKAINTASKNLNEFLKQK